MGLGGDTSTLADQAKKVQQDMAGPVCGDGGLCSGHGDCDTTTGTCKCQAGWEEGDCSIKTCPGAPPCSGHGLCSDGVCECVPGWGAVNLAAGEPDVCECVPGWGAVNLAA